MSLLCFDSGAGAVDGRLVVAAALGDRPADCANAETGRCGRSAATAARMAPPVAAAARSPALRAYSRRSRLSGLIIRSIRSVCVTRPVGPRMWQRRWARLAATRGDGVASSNGLIGGAVPLSGSVGNGRLPPVSMPIELVNSRPTGRRDSEVGKEKVNQVGMAPVGLP